MSSPVPDGGQGGRPSYHILHVTNDFRPDGTGITNLMADLMFAQLDAGHKVTVVTSDGPDNPLSKDFVHGGGLLHETARLDGAVPLLRESRRLARAVRQERVDVLHAHTVRGLALILATDPRLARRTVFTVHNDFQPSSRLSGLTRRIVCVSRASQRLMRRRLPLRRRSVRVILNGTLGSRRMPPVGNVVPVPMTGPTVLFVGGLSTPRKGVEFLVEVFAGVVRERPDARLVVVGNRDTPRVEALAAELLPAGCYRFAGYSTDPRELMKSATVLAVPSFEEPFGLVALEARSCGLPVVASDVGGLPEVLDGGAAGVLLPPGDVARWRTALLRALGEADAPVERTSPGDGGLDRFSVTRMEQDYARLYAEVLG